MLRASHDIKNGNYINENVIFSTPAKNKIAYVYALS